MRMRPVTPLRPAGHFPLKGRDHARHRFGQSFDRFCRAMTRSISPLEGEMAGRPEAGLGGKRFDA
ncbi:lytic murein transglycosylase [Mesorhizobium microcysteis]|uniref:Lytic murein transglycosylase n=1 Tax=Neoaquamicrobium microcysteis TaxID=2682781 RepID=A0A5D4GPN4_9HYPH|nr:lytic murein transglycosylase [Mesorhizobium microcysteis]